MSMLGISYLNDIVNKISPTEPNQILDELRERVKFALMQKLGKSLASDGMDMALCAFNNKTKG